MKNVLFITTLFLTSLLSAVCQASSANFSCKVEQIKDEDAVMYFELEKGTLIEGDFKAKEIKVGALEYSGREVKVRASNPIYVVQFQDPETGNWSFEINYTSGVGRLKDASGSTQVLANCIWKLGMNPFRQPDISLGN